MNSKKIVIFDFDGTLADVSTLLRELYAELAKERGWPELTDTAYKKLRKGSIQQAIRWVGIRPWQIPGLLREGRNLFRGRSDEVELFYGIPKLVHNLSKQDLELYVLSSNSPSTIKKVLRSHGIGDKMHILKRPSLFGKDKSINKLVENEHYDKQYVWMIGDEVRDIDGANKAGVNSIAVTWGLQDESILKKANPTAIAKKPADIERIINNKVS